MLPRIVRGFLAATLWLPAAALHAAPVIFPSGIQNAASFADASLPTQSPSGTLLFPAGIAPGSIIVVRGAGIGPEQPVWGALPYRDRLPDSTGGSKVIIRSPDAGTQAQAWLMYSSSQQINAIVPSSVPVGPAEVIVSFGGESSEPAAISIRPSAPGLFAVAQNGSGAGVIQNYEPAGNQLNQMTRPARPGQYVVLWGTGLGAIDGPDNVRPPVGPVNSGLVVEIGGVALTPDYAGRAPGFPGVDQINVRLPDDGSIEEGCYVRVQVRSGDYPSRQVHMAIEGTPADCSHPWALSHEMLARLDAGLTIKAASVGVSSSFLDAGDGMDLSARFATFTPSQVVELRPWSFTTRFPDPFLRIGVCRLSSGTVIGSVVTPPSGGPPSANAPSIGLDAGMRLFLDGPDDRSVKLVKSPWFSALGIYEADTETGKIPYEFMTGGAWTLVAAGGPGVPAFGSSFMVPPPVHAELPEFVDRSRDLTVSWDPIPGAGILQIEVVVFGPPGENPNIRELDRLSCGASITDGSFTIPSASLSRLAPAAGGVIGLQLIDPQPSPVVFSIPGLDHASFTPANSYYRTTEIQ